MALVTSCYDNSYRNDSNSKKPSLLSKWKIYSKVLFLKKPQLQENFERDFFAPIFPGFYIISINGVEFDFYHVNKQSTVFFSLTMNTTRHFLNPSGWITFALLSFRFKQMFHRRKSAKKNFFLADVALVGSILTTPVFYSETTYAYAPPSK